MKAVLVLNGEPPALSRLKNLASRYDVYVADGGAKVCRAAGIRPKWVVGDFDSQSPEELPEDWEVLKFPEQDRTDFQKLLSTLPETVREIMILGGLGRRLDHLLTNLLIASKVDGDKELVFESGREKLIRVTPACPFRRPMSPGSTLSIIPLEKVEAVRTSGLKWNLKDQAMGPGGQLGQSNQVEDAFVEIVTGAGTLFVWLEV